MKRILYAGLLLLLLGGLIFFQGPRLTKSLDVRLISSNNDIRYMAYKDLGKLERAEQIQFLSVMFPHLQDKDPHARRFSLYVIRIIGEKSDEVSRTVFPLLADPSRMVAREAVITVTWFGPDAVPPSLHALPQLSEDIQIQLMNLLHRQGETILPHLIEALKSTSSQVRVFAAILVGQLGENGGPAMSALTPNLKDENREVRIMSALAINQIDPHFEKTLPVLKEIVTQDKWGSEQYEALTAMRNLGPHAKSARRILEKQCVKRIDGFLLSRYPKPAIAEALHSIKPRPTSYQALKWDLTHKNPVVRYRAAWYLGQTDIPLGHLTPTLIQSLEDTDSPVAGRVLYALQKMGLRSIERYHREALPKIILCLENKKLLQQVEGIDTIIKMALEELGGKVISPVMGLLQNGQIRFSTADQILAHLPLPTYPALVPYLEYGHPQVRLVSALNLGRQESTHDLVIKELEKATKNTHVAISSEAKVLLKKLKDGKTYQ